MADRLPKSAYGRWRYALKPDSWPKLFVPATFGQALGAAHLGRVDVVDYAAGMALTFLLLAFIVLMNDWGDREVDAIKRRRFPHGCSPKTIPDGILPAGNVFLGGLLAGAGALAFAWVGEGWLGRPLLFEATAGCLGVFVAYTLPPLKLNYRGGGELLEMLGVGLLLPWLHAYLQGGLGVESLPWLPRPAAVLPGMAALAFASAVASGLSDEVSDRLGGKRTFTTLLGNPAARRLAELSLAVGALAWLLAGLFAEHVPLVAAAVAGAVVLFHLRRVVRQSTSAVTNAFEAQKVYKQHLHAAVWQGARTLAVLLLLIRLFFR